MGSLLGNLVFAGLTTLLTTQSVFNALNVLPNMFTVSSTWASTAPPDVALFQPSAWGQALTSLGGVNGWGALTMCPLLVTRGPTFALWYNPNTTALPGDMKIEFVHSIAR